MKIAYYFLLSFSLFLGSCATFYTPSVHNVPLISSQGESNISIATDGRQIDLQVTHGITNTIALTGNFTRLHQRNMRINPEFQDVMQGGTYVLGQAGAGYFKKIGDNLVFETYGLLGLGRVENHQVKNSDPLDMNTGFISSNLFKSGFQPNFGYKGEYFSVAASTGVFYLRYSNIEGDLRLDDIVFSEYLTTNNSHLLIEPSLTIKGGLKNIKMQFQYVYCYNVSTPDFAQNQNLLSMGVSFNFNAFNSMQ